MGGIPGQKPKQTLPERTGYFLLMQHGDEVFLSQRPPVGLWGGLFCFPQFADEAELREWLAQRQIKADNLTQLTAFRHTFSHFHLDIVPMWLTVHSCGACMDEGNALWYNFSAAAVGRSGGPRGALVATAKSRSAGINFRLSKRINYEQNHFCTFLQREADGQDFQLYPGELGKRIYNEISKEAWAQWQHSRPC